jgi:hypothetical protein
MLTSSLHYTFTVKWSPHDTEWIALVAEFPSLSWLDPNPVDALRGIVNIVHSHVHDMTLSGEPLPEMIK